MGNRKISIIGDGAVGSSIAYTLMLGREAEEIVIIDLNQAKAEGDAMDMGDGQSFLPAPKIIRAGGYPDVRGSRIIVITAGAAQKPGETRLDLLKKNAAIMSSVIEGLKPYLEAETILLIVSNPVDILSYLAYRKSGLPFSRVIGSGTVLDTSRLKTVLSEDTGIDPRSIHALVAGEHGDSEVALWSSAMIGGLRLADYCKACGRCGEKASEHLDELFAKVRNATYAIIERKGATNYAVALAVQRIVAAILNNERSVLTVSTLVANGFEGKLDDVYLSLPSVIGEKGVERVLGPSYAKEEEEAIIASGQALKEKIKELSL
jgi:L-lactate dehydrogenase